MKRIVTLLVVAMLSAWPALAVAAETVKAKLSSDADREFELAEKVTAARKAYLENLGALYKFYVATHQTEKAKKALAEFNALKDVPRYKYFVGGGRGPAVGGVALRDVPAANALYEEGMRFKDYPALPDSKKRWLEKAIANFHEIIVKYPHSDKVGDAAFRLGEIYAGWYYKDYGRAAEYFTNSALWEPDADFNARFRAADLYDRKLKDWRRAKPLYEDCIARSHDDDSKKKARTRLAEMEKLLGRR